MVSIIHTARQGGPLLPARGQLILTVRLRQEGRHMKIEERKRTLFVHLYLKMVCSDHLVDVSGLFGLETEYQLLVRIINIS